MGSSFSKIFKRKGRKDECSPEVYQPRPLQRSYENVNVAVHQSVPDLSSDESVDLFEYQGRPHLACRPRIDDDVHQNDVYYDDEDMIRFVSALSLAEFNQASPKPLPKETQRIPDALEEFFLSLDAHFSAGPAGSSNIQRPHYDDEEEWDDMEEEEEELLVDVSVEETRECAICVEAKPLKDFPPVTAACQHPDQTCLACVQNWLSQEVESTDWDKIRCVACKELVEYDDMKRLMTKAAFEKYDQYSRNSTLSNMPNFRWCIAPGCRSGQIHESGIDGPIFLCTGCLFKTCVIHNVAWHEGETCDEYTYRQDPTLKQAEEKASAAEIKETSKPCPGPNCKVNITRNGGCEHMKCTRCKYEFCWVCFADYEKIRKLGNSAHESSCRLHSDNLPD